MRKKQRRPWRLCHYTDLLKEQLEDDTKRLTDYEPAIEANRDYRPVNDGAAVAIPAKSAEEPWVRSFHSSSGVWSWRVAESDRI